MYFRPDNVADVLGLTLAVILVFITYMFQMKMKKNEASAWAEAGRNMFIGAVVFAIGMAITLSTILFNDSLIRELLNLIGNGLWVITSYFAVKMLRTIKSALEVMMGV